MMPQSRLKNRSRSHWEALDLGNKIYINQAKRLSLLWFALSLPVFLLISFLLWRQPFWAAVVLWWTKPMYEGAILNVISNGVFGNTQSFSQDYRQGLRLMFRSNIIKDLSINRLNSKRSLLLPITVLEKLQGKNNRHRCREISQQIGSKGTWLSFFGIHFEMILTYGLLFLIVWFTLPNPLLDAGGSLLYYYQSLVNFQYVQDWFGSLDLFFHFSNLLYFAILCFWGPIYVCCGFSLYLQARTRSEAWDLKLAFQNIGKRLGQSALMLLCAAVFFTSTSSTPAFAQDSSSTLSQQQQAMQQDPFMKLERVPTTKETTKPPLPNTSVTPLPFASLIAYVVGTLVVIIALYCIVQAFRRRPSLAIPATQNKPSTLFGLDVAQDSLPKDPLLAAQALIAKNNIQAALSLLYRASLIKLLHEHHLPIAKHHTEGEVLFSIKHHANAFYPFMQELTQAWQQVTYGLYPMSQEEALALCHGFEVAFQSKARHES